MKPNASINKTVSVSVRSHGVHVGRPRERLAYKGASLINEKSIRLVLYGENMPTDIDFSEVTINTAIKLKDVQLYWKHYKK